MILIDNDAHAFSSNLGDSKFQKSSLERNSWDAATDTASKSLADKSV